MPLNIFAHTGCKYVTIKKEGKKTIERNINNIMFNI
jgi:hypothetical protein